jgi:hypothetical protein
VIYLNWKERGLRMRFVLAHELAHVMLRKPEIIGLLERRSQVSLLDDEEGLADRVAATLLVPDSWVESIGSAHPSLASLRSMADHAEVAVTTLASRISAAGIDVGLLHWQRGGRSWHLVDRPGAPLCLHGRIRLSEAGIRAIDRVRSKESEMTVDGYINTHLVTISGWGFRRGDDVIQLIQPSRDVVFPTAPNMPWPASLVSTPYNALCNRPGRFCGELTAMP